MNRIKNSIIAKIGFAIFFFVFIIFIAYYQFLNIQIKTFLEDQRKQQLQKESDSLCSEIDMFLQKYIVLIDLAKNNSDYIKLAKEVDNRYTKRENPVFSLVTKELADMKNSDKNITNAFIALTNASDIITNNYNYEIASDYKLAEREWYNNTVKKNKTTITTPYIDLITNKTAITIAAPLKDENGTIIGVVGVDILMKDLNSIMKNYKSNTTSDMGLVYDTGQILYYSGFKKPTENTDKFLQNILDKDASNKIISGKRGITQYKYQGNDKYIAYLPIKNTNLLIFTNVSESVIFAPINKFIYFNLIILLGLIIVIAVFLLFLRRIFSNPLVNICNELENYDKIGTISIPDKYVRRKDEIGILSKGIISMTNNISNYVLALKERNLSLLNAKDIINKERILFKTTLRSLGDGVISTDKDGNIQTMNIVAENLTGWSIESAYGLPFDTVFQIINEFSRCKCDNLAEKVLETGIIASIENDTLLVNKNGKEIPIEDSASPIIDDKENIVGVVVVFRDYTDQKLKQAKITYLSYHDQLTGLYNRHFFEEELNRLDSIRNLPLSLAMLDVNGLKLTNDAFGHQMGDKLLKTVAEVIKSVCREDDIISRIGGDEFVLLLPNTDNNGTELIIKRIYREIEQAKLDNIVLSVSIGWNTKTFSDQNIMNVFAKAEENMYRRKLVESQSMRNETIQVIMKTLNEANERERMHSEKVSKISRKIGEFLNLEQEELKEIEISGLLHDIGKIAIDSAILNKPGKLTIDEYEIIKKHPEVGYQILKSVDTYSNLSEYILAHHEQWDGSGYPRGLKGEEIPMFARIISVADSFEAMTADRSYRKAMCIEAAIEELKRCAGTHFDPHIIQVFCANFTILK